MSSVSIHIGRIDGGYFSMEVEARSDKSVTVLNVKMTELDLREFRATLTEGLAQIDADKVKKELRDFLG